MPILPPGARGSRPPNKSGGVAKAGESGGVAKVGESGGVGVSARVTTSGLKRPPPPGKTNKLAELYQGGGMESEGGTTRQGTGRTLAGDHSNTVGVPKDKTELQASIRSLKDDNEALVDINKNLEEKLFMVSLE